MPQPSSRRSRYEVRLRREAPEHLAGGYAKRLMYRGWAISVAMTAQFVADALGAFGT